MMADTLDKNNWCLRLNSKNAELLIGYLNKLLTNKSQYKITGYAEWYYGLKNGTPYFNALIPFADVITHEQLTAIIQ